MTTSARIGADDVDFFDVPCPSLLREISGIEPVPSGTHVLLDEQAGVRSTQRLALAKSRGGVEVRFWPAELKSQAAYLYQAGRGMAMVATARDRGWDVRPSPHLAFRNSRPSQRLYMAPDVDAAEYAKRWEGADGRWIGQHSREEVRQGLWPWLKERDYATDAADPVLAGFLSILGRRGAHLRPGMRFRRRWAAEAARDRRELALEIRGDVNAILAAADEPTLAG